VSDGYAHKSTKKPSRTAGVAAIGIALFLNLIPIIGVLFWGWSAFALIFLYWLENVVIGVRTLAQMLATGLLSGGAMGPGGGVIGLVGAIFLCAFFCVHYGMFCLAHGFFVVVMFRGDAGVDGDSPFGVVDAATHLIQSEPNLLWGLASIAIWQAVKFVIFLLRGEARKTDVKTLMGAPYPRIIILHVAIIFGGALVMMLNEPIMGLLALALFKTAFDVADVLGIGQRDEPIGQTWDRAFGKERDGGGSTHQQPRQQDDA
jgi:hypothetical protein